MATEEDAYLRTFQEAMKKDKAAYQVYESIIGSPDLSPGQREPSLETGGIVRSEANALGQSSKLPELPSAISHSLVPLPLKQIKQLKRSSSSFSSIHHLDFQRKNIQSVKWMSGQTLCSLKGKIDKQVISSRRLLDQPHDTKMLKSIYESLQIELRNYFSKKRPFLELFQEVNYANYSFSEVIHTVSCYRVELGNTLNSILQNYNLLFRRILELTFKNDVEKERFVERKIYERQKEAERIQYAKVETDKRVKLLERIIKTKNSEIKSIKIYEEGLEYEVRNLRDILRNEVLASELEQQKKEKRIELRKQAESGKEESEKFFQGITKNDDQKLARNVEDLLKKIGEMEVEKDKRKLIIQDMGKLHKSLMKQGKQDAETQVEEGELLWQPQNYINLQLKPSLDKLKYEPPKKHPHATLEQLRKEDLELAGAAAQESKKSEKINVQQSTNFLTPASAGPMNTSLLQRDSRGVGENWNIPVFVIAFIANSLQQQEMGRVLPWPYFRKLIYEVYDDRIKNGPEIYGALNTSYLTFEEYLLIFFLQTYKLRRLAEIKLIEFLTSLRHYVKKWPRARIFAHLMGIIGRGDFIETESSASSCDPYLQDFFLYCYQLCYTSLKLAAQQNPAGQRDDIIENDDENTFLRLERERSLTSQILIWMGQSELKKWNNKVRRNSKTGPDSAGIDCELIDLDVLLELYMDEFIEKKKRIQKALTKNFSKLFNAQEGIFSIDQIRTVAQQTIPKNLIGRFVNYAGDVSINRVFLYALTSGSNTFAINSKQFLQGCARFGVDNPFPFVAKRLSLFGLDVNVEELLQNAGLELLRDQGQVLSHTPSSNQILSSSNKAKRIGVKSPSLAQNLKKAPLSQTSKLASPRSKPPQTLLVSGSNDAKPSAPSFSTSSSLFAQHFSILRELRQSTRHLKTVAEQQKDDVDGVFKVIEKIIVVLDNACQFLNFPVT